MLRTVLALVFFVSSCSSLHTGPAVVSRSRPMVMMPAPGKAWQTANVPRGRVQMNPFENLKQIQDQRVAGLSHVNLAPGKCTLPLQEAIELMKQWKEEIGDDAEKFAERARSDSHCPTGPSGGNLGFVVRKDLCEQFDAVLFNEEPGRCYGPVTTPAGLHLIFLHSCREPKSRGEALLGLPFSLGGEETAKK